MLFPQSSQQAALWGLLPTSPVHPLPFSLGHALPVPSGMQVLGRELKTQESDLISPNGCSLESSKLVCIALPCPALPRLQANQQAWSYSNNSGDNRTGPIKNNICLKIVLKVTDLLETFCIQWPSLKNICSGEHQLWVFLLEIPINNDSLRELNETLLNFAGLRLALCPGHR